MSLDSYTLCVESLCEFDKRVCNRRCLPGSRFCDFHVLNDSQSSYNQCSYTYGTPAYSQCMKPALSTNKPLLCYEHRQQLAQTESASELMEDRERSSGNVSPVSANSYTTSQQPYGQTSAAAASFTRSPDQLSMMQLWERQEDLNFPQGRMDLLDCWSSDGDSVSSSSDSEFSSDDASGTSNDYEVESESPSITCARQNLHLLRRAQWYTEGEVLSMAIDRWTNYIHLCRRSMRLLRMALTASYVPHAVNQSAQKKQAASASSPLSSIARQPCYPSNRLMRERLALRKFGRHSAKVANQRHEACMSKFAVMCGQLAPWRRTTSNTQQHCKYRDPTTTTWEQSCSRSAVPLLPFCLHHLISEGRACDSLSHSGSGASLNFSKITGGEQGSLGAAIDSQSPAQHLFRRCGAPLNDGESRLCNEPVISWSADTHCPRHTLPRDVWASSENPVVRKALDSINRTNSPVQIKEECLEPARVDYAPDDVVIVLGRRSPVGKLCGSLSSLHAHEIGQQVIASLLETACPGSSSPSREYLGLNMHCVFMGQVLTAGCGQNPARQTVHGLVPNAVPATTVNMMCGSGLLAVALAADQLRLQSDGKFALAGGQESMSRAGHVLRGARPGCGPSGVPVFGDTVLVDTIKTDGLTDAFTGLLMGHTAENIAHEFQISRERQDDFAKQSQDRYQEALAAEAFQTELVRINPKLPNAAPVTADEHPRPGANLTKLRPAFKRPDCESATVTPGNSSGLNDGAAAVLLCRFSCLQQDAFAVNVGAELCRIVDWVQVGCEPHLMGLGPVYAVKALLAKTGWLSDTVDRFELNEAFAAQSIAVMSELGLDDARVNVNGGSIAIGHPLGCSGARILVTLIHELARLRSRLERPVRGIATLCIGGGMGIAMAIEKL